MRSMYAFLLGFCALLPAFTIAQNAAFSGEVLAVISLKDSALKHVITDPELYNAHWDTLAQPRFWRRVMNLSPDSAVLNVASTRQILEVFASADYEEMSDEEKKAFKKRKARIHGFPENTRMYVTYGKSDYYQFDNVLHSIDRGIEVFTRQQTDPWYAQAILLIESPGQIRRSNTGAYGSFQLMKYVALEEGLVVNSRVDEREDFDKAAGAAARYIRRVCIPEVRKMLDRQGLTYDERDMWFRLMVLHTYHAGAGNVAGALRQIKPHEGGISLIQTLWRTEYKGFRNASQNYSQVALASLMELDTIVSRECLILEDDIRPIPMQKME